MKKGLPMLVGFLLCTMGSARNGHAGARDACKADIASFSTADCPMDTCPQRLQAKFGPAKFSVNEPGKRVAGAITYQKNVPDGKTRVVDVLVDFTCDHRGCVVSCTLD